MINGGFSLHIQLSGSEWGNGLSICVITGYSSSMCEGPEKRLRGHFTMTKMWNHLCTLSTTWGHFAMTLKYGLSCVHSQLLAVKIRVCLHTHIPGNGGCKHPAWGKQTASLVTLSFIENVKRICFCIVRKLYWTVCFFKGIIKEIIEQW